MCHHQSVRSPHRSAHHHPAGWTVPHQLHALRRRFVSHLFFARLICITETLDPGHHTIDIFYDGIAVPGSPFTVNVRRGCDPKKVRAFGPGLEYGVVNQPNTFTVETKGNEWHVTAVW